MKGHMQYQLLKILSQGISRLPYSLICQIGRGIGHLYYLVAGRQLERGIQQAMRGLNISRSEAKAVLRQVFCNLGQTLMEVLYIPALSRENISRYVSIEGLPHLEEALKAGRGVVILTAHMGNWEWMGAALAHTGLPITTIVKPQPNAQYTRILNEYREMSGLEVFNRGSNEIVKAARALKRGKALGFLADQDGGRDGVFVDFLGKKASTPAGPAIFAQKFNSAVVPVYSYHLPGGGHQIVIEPPLEYEHDPDPKQEVLRNTVKMTHVLENAIKQHPAEWLWFFKRWNTPESN
ncbi:lysophospholipid acyltransferase family protein [Acetonema longum]|uniref:Lipid A biosynthesis acyltransferase n=1 Tax=Acetonema longum DSM 6540 TaxID=1009370 RepID=F7NFR4_9FIRM|nr:lysophospholipid acyltransferase family protein [Acetonema longum]EGO65127.1 lipid A biosynthesis acyltransferase [Acetonema longum DSM 6540]